jgi:hypothetical protein
LISKAYIAPKLCVVVKLVSYDTSRKEHGLSNIKRSGCSHRLNALPKPIYNYDSMAKGHRQCASPCRRGAGHSAATAGMAKANTS